jgi:hypothetical protein
MIDDAKAEAYTTKEARELATDEGLTDGETFVLASRRRILATTRALETALREIDCGQDTVCATPPGCVRHWEERNRELVRERDTARFDRDAARALAADLAKALEGMIEPAEDVGSELRAISAGCGEYLSRLDAAIDAARAALAKAKGGTP